MNDSPPRPRKRAPIDTVRFAAALGQWMAAHDLTQNAAAERLGVSQSRVSAWLLRSSVPSGEVAERILPTIGVTAAELRTSDATPLPSNVVLIPRGGLVGGGALPAAPDDDEADPYPANELRRLIGFDPSNLVYCIIVGDSMLPRLRPGDRVIYLPTTEITDHGLYILLVDDFQIVKRVQRLGGGALALIPFNTDYRIETFTPTSDDDGHLFRSDLSGLTASLHVVGKVVWYPMLA